MVAYRNGTLKVLVFNTNPAFLYKIDIEGLKKVLKKVLSYFQWELNSQYQPLTD